MSKLTERLTDMRTGALYTAGRLAGIGTGTWDKFLFGGSTSLEAKTGDYDITDKAAIAALFTRDDLGSEYMANITSQADGAGKAAIKAKIKSDVLASMQQAVGLRYTSRVRHMMAAASRLRAIGSTDIETIRLRTEDV